MTITPNDVDAIFLARLHRFYTIPLLEDWIARAERGMKVRKDGQLARWRLTLGWLEMKNEPRERML